MATRDEIFPSKYLKVADLNGKPIVVRIDTAPTETLKAPDGREQLKTVLYFKGTKKALPLNMTNWDSVADISGEYDSAKWPGTVLELYPDTTPMQGKVVDCIRIRAPSQRELPKARPPAPKSSGDLDDEIPFALAFVITSAVAWFAASGGTLIA